VTWIAAVRCGVGLGDSATSWSRVNYVAGVKAGLDLIGHFRPVPARLPDLPLSAEKA
jgi:hypothetical protein